MNQKKTIKKLKVMTVVGTRPEIIRLSCVIKKLNNCSSIEHLLVHTGQNYDYELNEIFFKDFELPPPDIYLNAAGKNAVETVGIILTKSVELFEKNMPDALLILGDTNSCLVSIAAKKYKIPIFHMEAGNRCFDQRVPEETNRKLVDHIADINLTYSDIAREYLLKEGLPADRIIKTGSPMCEVLRSMEGKINNSDIVNLLRLKSQDFFVVSLHREENINTESHFVSLFESLNEIATRFSKRIIVSTHPRTRKMLKEIEIKHHSLIEFLKPLSFSDYICLQQNALCVLSDSGTISEESSILGFKALNVREAHERPEAMEEASVMMVGKNPSRIFQALNLILEERNIAFATVRDYSFVNVSDKVVRIIISYVDYVRRVVWQQN